MFRVSVMQRKVNNEPDFKESSQSFCFKARPLPNFYRKHKQAKDTSQQVRPFSTLLHYIRECGFNVVCKSVTDAH
ncbi:hypothetical protein HU200_053643 [Digitaria exilis]|uniref:Uncharacterized protein n=1 Tax=Digitaria exilis TaxID=1010633 RepID=A0A835AHC3_9POAL|nr:hypothetical protein HU200_053643 [Digitaria exilis]